MKSDKKIIILTYYNFPCTHPVLGNVFAKELGRNHEIIWLLQGDIAKGKKKKWFNSHVLLTRAFRGNHWYKKIANRIWSWQRFFQIICLLISGKENIVLIRDMPIEAFLISFLRFFFRFKLFYQHSAPLHDITIAAFKVDKGPKRFWYLIHGLSYGFFLGKVLKKADLVFTISDFHKKELVHVTGGDKFVTLTMGVDEEWLERDRCEIPGLKKIRENNFVLVYFGTLSFTRKPIFILKSFIEVKKRLFNCKLILIGKTSSFWEEKELESTCRRFGIESDVIFTGQVDRNKLQDYLAYCDLSISAIPPENYYKISSPTKIYESLGNGVPVIGNKEIYEQEKVILESGGGLVVNYNIASFCDAIIKLLNNPELRKDMAKKGKEYVKENYSYQNIAKNIAPLFDG